MKTRNAYNEYLKQFAGQIEPTRLYATGKLLDGATLLPAKNGKIEGSMQYEATYRLADGRIAELYNSGALSYLFAWPTDAAYNEYRTPMSFSVYHEM